MVAIFGTLAKRQFRDTVVVGKCGVKPSLKSRDYMLVLVGPVLQTVFINLPLYLGITPLNRICVTRGHFYLTSSEPHTVLFSIPYLKAHVSMTCKASRSVEFGRRLTSQF